jgi:hypothetical protein
LRYRARGRGWEGGNIWGVGRRVHEGGHRKEGT